MRCGFSISTFLEKAGKLPRILRLVISAVLFSLGFIWDGCFLLNWVALAPLAFEIFHGHKTLKRVFSSLFCFFFVFYVCAYSWLISLYPLDFAGLGTGGSIAVIIIGLTVIPLLHSFEMSLSIFAFHLISRKMSLTFRCVALSFGYVLGEYVQGLGPLGFPWARIYVSQISNLLSLQSAKLFGAYFVTFVVILVNCLIAAALLDKKYVKRYAASAFAVFALNNLYGVLSVASTQAKYNNESAFDAVVLQGNVSSYEKWDSNVSSYDKYISLANEAAAFCKDNDIEPSVAVLPETAFPTVSHDIENGKIVKSYSAARAGKTIAQILSCPVLTGTFTDDLDKGEYNSLVCYNDDGSIGGVYHKTKLVPFGEFVPYRSVITALFPPLAEINMLSDDLAAGDITQPINADGINAACLVCFDSVFSETARAQVKNGAEIIAVSTNDSWYKTSKALEHHGAHSVMRAIENSRPVVRSANTGISMLIEPTGKIVCTSDVNETQFLAGTLHKSDDVTLYTVTGDITLYCCFAFGIALIVAQVIKKIRRTA